jgi:CO/xanthine dehydrogenase FAD-binding subunit
MEDFVYSAPASLAEALSLLKKGGKAVKLLAGGTDLIIQLKDKKVNPGTLIDIKKIPELNRLELDSAKTLHIGAAVPLSDIIAFPPVRQYFGILYQGCSIIGAERIRNRATMGGNICNAAPSADSAPALMCLGARAIVAGKKGYRVIPIESFFRGPGQTSLGADELLVEIEIPDPPAHSAGYYMRLTPREEMDIAVVGAGSFLVRAARGKECREARIALGAVGPTPVRVTEAETFLKGKVLDSDTIEKASEIAAKSASPISDVRGSSEYRREIVKVLVRHTLQKSWEAINS